MNQAINPASLTPSLETEFLDRLLTRLHTGKLVLPTLPEIALKIQDLIRQEHSSLEALSELINQDAAITAKLMQVSNSPVFRVGAPINTVDAAIKRLGRDVTQNIVIGMASEQLFHSKHPTTHRKLKQCCQHAMEVLSLAAGYSHQFPH